MTFKQYVNEELNALFGLSKINTKLVDDMMNDKKIVRGDDLPKLKIPSSFKKEENSVLSHGGGWSRTFFYKFLDSEYNIKNVKYIINALHKVGFINDKKPDSIKKGCNKSKDDECVQYVWSFEEDDKYTYKVDFYYFKAPFMDNGRVNINVNRREKD